MNKSPQKQTDLIGKLQKYAYLVPDEFKLKITDSRVGFCRKGLKMLRDSHMVDLHLRVELYALLRALK